MIFSENKSFVLATVSTIKHKPILYTFNPQKANISPETGPCFSAPPSTSASKNLHCPLCDNHIDTHIETLKRIKHQFAETT